VQVQRTETTSEEMIKVEEKHNCKSYWRGEGLYDMKRDKDRKVKLFGITIWRHTENYESDLLNDIDRKPGFKNGK
jgi:hypothetical protein